MTVWISEPLNTAHYLNCRRHLAGGDKGWKTRSMDGQVPGSTEIVAQRHLSCVRAWRTAQTGGELSNTIGSHDTADVISLASPHRGAATCLLDTNFTGDALEFHIPRNQCKQVSQFLAAKYCVAHCYSSAASHCYLPCRTALWEDSLLVVVTGHQYGARCCNRGDELTG